MTVDCSERCQVNNYGSFILCKYQLGWASLRNATTTLAYGLQLWSTQCAVLQIIICKFLITQLCFSFREQLVHTFYNSLAQCGPPLSFSLSIECIELFRYRRLLSGRTQWLVKHQGVQQVSAPLEVSSGKPSRSSCLASNIYHFTLRASRAVKRQSNSAQGSRASGTGTVGAVALLSDLYTNAYANVSCTFSDYLFHLDDTVGVVPAHCVGVLGCGAHASHNG